MNMFENIKRPRAETNVINSFLTSFEKAKNLYKSKLFSTALPEFHTCYAILSPIYDIRPKTEVLFYLMKTQFYLKMYDECLQTKSTLLNYILQIQTQKEKYLNIYARVIAYDIIISFIKNSLDDSMKHTLDFISYVKNNETLPDISDKAYLFMRVLKGLLNVGKVSKSKQYELFMNEYNSMIVSIENKHGNKVKMIKSTMKELYKNFMSTKNRQYIFDELNAWFYKLKYGLNTDNKVVSFLDKKMHIYVRENNYQKLVEMLETFLHLNKIELSTYFGNNMDKYELINEQKNRIVCFDTIFGNFCGAFTIIFNHYFTDVGNNNNTMYNKSSHIKTLSKSFSASVFNKEHFEKRKKELFDQIRKGAEILEKKQTRHYKYYSSCNNMNHITNNNIFDYQDTQNSVFSLFKKRNSIYKCNEFDFGKDIVVPTPSIIEEDSKENCNSNRTSRGMIKTSKKNNYRVRTAKTGIFRKGNSVLPGISKLMKRNETHSEHLYCINNDHSHMNSNRTDELKSLLLYCNNNNLTPPTPTSMSNRVGNNKINYNKTQYTAVTTQNSSYIASIKKQTHFSLRNINNYYLLELHLHNYIKSSGSCSEKGNPVSDNQDALFKYEHFLLIRNFSVFGVCDGHGKNGKLISEAIIRLFPAYMHYLTMDNDLITKGHDINNLILSLFKIQEKPDVLDVNVIRYFYNKCELIYKNIPFIKKSLSEIHNQISEAFYRTHIDIKERLKIDHNASGSTVCTIFVYDNILYCANIGDSRALMCSYIFNRNKWECKQLTMDHKPNVTVESNRIRVLNGKVERAKDDKGEPVGPFRVWYKDSSTTINTEGIGPGLAMSRSIGDASAKAIGVCCEPELFEYHLHKDNKFIVIGTDGLWDNLTNEEVLGIGSECYDMKEKAEYVANMLVNKAKHNASQRKESKLLEQGYNKNTKITNVSSVIDDITCWVIYLDVKNDDEI